jgi:hypothetical protein
MHWLNWNDFNSILGIEKAVICACLNFRTQMEMNSCSILRLVSLKCYSYLEKWPMIWRSFHLRRLLMSVAGQKSIVERLWRKFFSDPSQWWDHRLDKVNRSNCCHTILLLMQKFSGFHLVLTGCIKHVKICG